MKQLPCILPSDVNEDTLQALHQISVAYKLCINAKTYI